MSIDRFADENGHLVVDDEMRDYITHMTPCDRVIAHTKPICGAPLDQVTKCLLDPDHEDHQHCGLRPNGTFVRWSDK